MPLRRPLVAALALLALTLPLSACHVHGHLLAPGQVKHVVDPPPGHGGVPPGQSKKS